MTLLLTSDWLQNSGDEVAVNFDTAAGLVDVHRHYQPSYSDSNIQLWIPDFPPEAVPTFPQPLGPLLAGTLDAGGAGILADWIDDHTPDWGEFTAALRRSTPDPWEPSGRVDELRYAIFGTDSVCWLIRTGEYTCEAMGENEGERAVTIVGNYGDEFWFLGFSMIGEGGLRRRWCRRVPPPDGTEAGERLLATFPAPPPGNS